MYRRSAIEQAGFFHDRYFAYYEDTDLALRLILHGYECAYVHEAVAVHRGSATGVRQSRFHVFHLRRNIEYLFWVDMVGSLAWRFLLPHLIYETIAFGGALLKGQGLTVLRAKAAVMRNIGWVFAERRKLRDLLVTNDCLDDAKRRLRACMTPWWRLFAARAAERRATNATQGVA